MTTTIDTIRKLTEKASRLTLAAGLGAIIGLAGPAVSFAQDRPQAEQGERCHGPGGRHGHHRGGRGAFMGRMAEELNLSDAQREQIRNIFQEARAQRGEGQRGDRGAMRRQIHERIQAVLTPAQRQQAQELRAQRGRQMLDRRVEHMTERLELSERQQQQVRGILQNAQMQRRALREQAENDPSSAREAMRGLHERTTASIRSVLNAEQQSRFDEMRQRFEGRRGRGHGHRRGGRGAGQDAR